MVDFAGWSLPVQFSGLIDEHRCVRGAAGLFDVSHMGEIMVEGPGALAGVDRLVSNECARLDDGQVLYTVACKEDGGILDDLLVYRLHEERFMLVVNGANADKMAAWTQRQLGGTLTVRDASPDFAQLALQGPRSRDILVDCPLFAGEAGRIRALDFYAFFETMIEGEPAIVSRTGYTGELGFEIYLPGRHAESVARALMAAGAPRGLKPAGLGARDTLRFEASYSLYGNELDEQTDPFEAGLAWLVKLDKGDFIGREALVRRKEDPRARRLLGFSLAERKIARHGYPVTLADETVGQVTSGTFAPSLERSLGLALVRRGLRKEPLAVEIRGQRAPLTVEKLPFYSQPALRA
ncbi:MAG: glycine cleavage system aminomethyltransferase GcvT [Candidatus Krumholzibacteriota bacterium]|nr:glycine cleavage system aminomethyltransferase GcvT [Candidatus Krumholzibacteriota bacterium]